MRGDIGTVPSQRDLNGLEIIEDRATCRRTGGKKGRYSKGRFLGKGGFAKCYEFQDVETKAFFAAKIVAKSVVSKPRTQAKLRSEISIHRALDHATVVKFYDCFEDSDNVYIILELCPNHTLNEFMRRRPSKRLSEAEAMFYAHELITCLRYLHGRRVIHRDLKLGNLFLDSRSRLKVGDFGLAAQLERDGEKKRTICGTPNYIAPEILDGKHGHSYEVDIWSFGVVLYTMLVGRPPFETSDLKTTYRRIRQNQYAFPDNVQMSEPAKDLISSILRTDPNTRPSLENILSSTWFSGSRLPPAAPPPPSIDQHCGPSPRLGGASARSETPERGDADFARIESPAPRCPLLDRSPSANTNRVLSSATNRQTPRSPSASAAALRGKPPPTQVPVKSIVARVESSPCRFDEARARDHSGDRHGALASNRPPIARSGNEENEDPCSSRGTPRATAVPVSVTPRTPTTMAFANDLPSPCVPRTPDAQGFIPRAKSVHHLGRDSPLTVHGIPRDAAVPGTASQPILREPCFGLARSATSNWQQVPAVRSFAPPVVLNPKGPSSAQEDAGRAAARSSSATCRVSLPQGANVLRGGAVPEVPPCTPGRRDFDRLEHQPAQDAPAASGTTTPVARSARVREAQGSAREREASASSPTAFLNALTQGLATPPATSARQRGAVSPSAARSTTGAGKLISGPPPASLAVAPKDEIAAHLPEMWVVKWVDYSSKYGIGYILSDGSIGVYFNDSTKAILAPHGKRFDYITRRTHERPEVHTMHTFDDYPEDIKKKVTLLRHFRGYMLTDSLEHKEGAVPGASGLPGPPAHPPHPAPPRLPEDGEGAPYVKKWARNKHAIMFQLSNKVVQVVFFDNTEAVLSSRSHTVTYVDKQGQVSSYPLSSALDVPSPELAKRLRYTRDILVGLLGPGRARHASGGA